MQGFFDAKSGFGEGAEYETDTGRARCIPLEKHGDSLRVQGLRERRHLSSAGIEFSRFLASTGRGCAISMR